MENSQANGGQGPEGKLRLARSCHQEYLNSRKVSPAHHCHPNHRLLPEAVSLLCLPDNPLFQSNSKLIIEYISQNSCRIDQEQCKIFQSPDSQSYITWKMLFYFVQKERKEGKKSLTEKRCWRAFPARCSFMAEIVLFPLCGLHLPLPRLEERDHFGQATCPCIPGPPPVGDRVNFCLGGQECQAVREDTTDARVTLLFPINPSLHGRKHFPWHITAPQECLADFFSQESE